VLSLSRFCLWSIFKFIRYKHWLFPSGLSKLYLLIMPNWWRICFWNLKPFSDFFPPSNLGFRFFNNNFLFFYFHFLLETKIWKVRLIIRFIVIIRKFLYGVRIKEALIIVHYLIFFGEDDVLFDLSSSAVWEHSHPGWICSV